MDTATSVTGKLFEKDWSRVRGSREGLGDAGKSFEIMRTAKIKTLGNMGASFQHTLRERETPNADPDRLKDNTILVGADTRATDALNDFQMQMREERRDMDAKMNTAEFMIRNLQALVENYKAQLDGTRRTLSRLVFSLGLADKGKETNAALEAHAKLEARIATYGTGERLSPRGYPG